MTSSNLASTTNVFSQSLPSTGPTTLHKRIRVELRERIASGAYQPHDRMPSESALMRHYGVSRITVRQALSDLEKERLIVKVPGKGSFVTKPVPFQDLSRLQGFAEAMGAQGHETFNKLLRLGIVQVSAQVAEKLQVPLGTEVIEIHRLRYLNREPVSLDISWVSAPLGAQLAREDLACRDIFLILENDYGLALGHADLSIEATLADANLAEKLEISLGAPVLRIERLTHGKDGTPLDYEHLHYRADNFRYRLRVHRA